MGLTNLAENGGRGITGPAGPDIAGLSSDGAQGIDVVGNVAIKGAQSGGPAKLGVGVADDSGSPYNAQFYVGANGEVVIDVDDASFASEALYVTRQHPAHGPYGGPLVKHVDFSGENQLLLDLESYAYPSGSLVGMFQVSKEGGLGLFGVAPPTAPRTLAQSVITAITDPNAKTAVQAIADALSDMGALTLT